MLYVYVYIYILCYMLYICFICFLDICSCCATIDIPMDISPSVPRAHPGAPAALKRCSGGNCSRWIFKGMALGRSCSSSHLPSGYVKIAIENGHSKWIFPLKMVIFHSYVSLPEGTSCFYGCKWGYHSINGVITNL